MKFPILRAHIVLSILSFCIGSPTIAKEPTVFRQKLTDAYEKRAKAHLLSKVVVISTYSGKDSFLFFGDETDKSSKFEIGSITKSFTGILLAKIASKRSLPLESKLEEFFPILSGTYSGSITLLALATHKARLPRTIPSISAIEGLDEKSEFLDFLSTYKPDDKAFPEGEAVYSNLGFDVLGMALAEIENRKFSDLIAEEIFQPLHMNNCSSIGLAGKSPNLHGHDFVGNPAPPHLSGDLSSASGSIRSCATDLRKFLMAVSGRQITPIDSAIRVAKQNALGFDSSTEIFIAKNGGTKGFTSKLFVDAKSGDGVLVLSNISNLVDTASLAKVALGGSDTFIPPVYPNLSDKPYEGRYKGKGTLFSGIRGIESAFHGIAIENSPLFPVLYFLESEGEPVANGYSVRMLESSKPGVFMLRDGIGLLQGEFVEIKKTPDKVILTYFKGDQVSVLGSFKKLK